MTTITATDILNHRKMRKDSGASGCITGQPIPPIDFFSFRDVQSWKPDDPKNPHCFCFDCRSLWDSDGTIDAELANSGHERALSVYGSLHYNNLTEPSSKRQGSETYNGLTLHVSPPTLFATTFDEIPVSLPAPRHRNVLNESRDERLRNDLHEYLGELKRELIVTMDSKRSVFDDIPGRDVLLEKIAAAEEKIAHKIDSVNAILTDM